MKDKKIAYSEDVIKRFFITATHYIYKARCLRKWAENFLQTGSFPTFNQGSHSKTTTCITNEDFQQLMKEILRNVPNEKRNPTKFKNYLNNTFFQTTSFPDCPTKISNSTARRWMLFLNFSLDKQGRGYYTDEHNRADIVKYRDELFLPRMKSMEPRMAYFEGDEMEKKILNLKENEKELVLITHDETTFYCNDGSKMVWMENGKHRLLPKSKGFAMSLNF